MAALVRGIREAVNMATPEVSNIHVFADNQAALTAILTTNPGPSQLLSIAACRSVRPWLQQSPSHRVHLWWCPGHQNIAGNVAVDHEAGIATSEPSTNVFFAYACQTITAHAHSEWRREMTHTKYRGQNNVLGPEEFSKCTPTPKNCFLASAEKSNKHLARLVL